MRCLALDVGERRTGIAVGEVLARPLMTLERRSKVQDFSTIASLVREHRVDTLVVGLPFNMDGSQVVQAQRTVRYAERLRDALAEMDIDVELVFWDERLTTEYAKQMQSERQDKRSQRRESIDAVAAAVILQSYLDRQMEQ